MKKPYQVTYWLDDRTQADLRTTTACWNQFSAGLPQTPESMFELVMQIASGEVIAERLGYLIEAIGAAVLSHGGQGEASGDDVPGD